MASLLDVVRDQQHDEATSPTQQARPAKDRRAHKDHIIVVGIDGTTQSLGWVKSGEIDAEVSQPLSDFGTVVFKYGIVPILAGKPLQAGAVTEGGAIWSPAKLVTDTQPGPVILLAPTLVDKSKRR